LDNCLTDGSRGSLLESVGLTLRLHGATVVKTITDDVSHVIVDSRLERTVQSKEEKKVV